MEHIIKEAGEQLLSATQKTFETITFASVENAEEYDSPFEHPETSSLFHSSIDIHCADNSTFKMEIAISKRYLGELLQSVNPMIETITDNDLIDMIGELTNTLSGSFMLQLEALTGEFKLGLPISQEGIDLSDNPILSHTYIIDDVNPVYVGLFKTR